MWLCIAKSHSTHTCSSGLPQTAHSCSNQQLQPRSFNKQYAHRCSFGGPTNGPILLQKKRRAQQTFQTHTHTFSPGGSTHGHKERIRKNPWGPNQNTIHTSNIPQTAPTNSVQFCGGSTPNAHAKGVRESPYHWFSCSDFLQKTVKVIRKIHTHMLIENAINAPMITSTRSLRFRDHPIDK